MKMLISVVIPCYNSSKSLEQVVAEIKDVINSRSGYDYQIILVNDNSPDNTFEVISSLCRQDNKIVGIDLSKNYGQASALMASIKFIKGDIAVCMDDDGQHPPREMFKLVDEVINGSDLVYARFPQKKHSLFKRITSRINTILLEMTNRKPKGIYISSYFALSKFAVNALYNYESPFPSLGAYILQVTRKISNVNVEHKARLYGKSNYSLKKLISLWMQSITNFSIVPLRFASVVGCVSAMIGIITAIVLIIRKLASPNIVVGYTSIISVILLIGGLIMLMLGVIGEYLGRAYMTLSNMPQYNIRNVLNDIEKSHTDNSENLK